MFTWAVYLSFVVSSWMLIDFDSLQSGDFWRKEPKRAALVLPVSVVVVLCAFVTTGCCWCARLEQAAQLVVVASRPARRTISGASPFWPGRRSRASSRRGRRDRRHVHSPFCRRTLEWEWESERAEKTDEVRLADTCREWRLNKRG